MNQNGKLEVKTYLESFPFWMKGARTNNHDCNLGDFERKQTPPR